ncbi:MAG: hypothetical protein KY466_08995, partial [Gemmatimonadetes bacterium]|nr:hypothetical protein [Gemmatimonadota bacterium]
TQPEGWARYTLDALGIPYAYIADTELRTLGDLRRRFDVILFPDQSGGAEQIFEGLDPEQGPLPYRASRAHPSLGFPDETADMTGGMRYEGLIALRDFVDRGGTLVALRSASTVPAAFGLVRGVDVIDTPQGLFIPGSLVRGRLERPEHPIGYGFRKDITLHHRFGPYLRVDDDRKSAVVVRYADGDIRLSGLVQNGARVAGQPAVLSVPAGEGHYVLFGFNPLNRHQTFMNFGLVWNVVLNWNDLEAGSTEDPAVADGY